MMKTVVPRRMMTVVPVLMVDPTNRVIDTVDPEGVQRNIVVKAAQIVVNPRLNLFHLRITTDYRILDYIINLSDRAKHIFEMEEFLEVAKFAS